MTLPNDKRLIVEHYDTLAVHYRKLWGEHLHHGYWACGDETKEQAQLKLVEHLASAANIPTGAEILDVGCGYGASSLYLARTYQAAVTGINLSVAQVEMAKRAAAEQQADATFLIMDAEAMTFDRQFDVLWSVESISHYLDVPRFFASACNLLKAGGTFALTDFFRRDGLSAMDTRKYIVPIENGMMAKVHTMQDYAHWLAAGGMRVERREVLNEHTAHTWDLCLDIIKDRALWELAFKLGPDFVTYLRGFQAMRAGYRSGAFVYGLMVARKEQLAASGGMR
jgi:tocopherol O-methyltransferase